MTENYSKYKTAEEILTDLEKIQNYLLQMEVKGVNCSTHSNFINLIGIIGLNIKNDFTLEKNKK